LADAIIDYPGWNIKAVAEQFLSWMQSNPPDIGNITRLGLCRYRDSGELFGPPRRGDAGNGACMRNLPVVLATLNRAQQFNEWSLQQSHITHNNPLSDIATLTLGRVVKQLLHGEDLAVCRQEIEQMIAQYSEFVYDPYPGKASAYIVDTMQTVCHYFFNTDSFESCLIATVNQGGDADTTGALAGMLAGAKYGVQAIPERWLAQLDSQVAAKIRQQTAALLALE